MADRRPAPPWLRNAVDSGPALIWLAVLLIGRDFRLATWVLVATSALALAVGLVVERRVAPIPAVSGALALVFGGLSLWLHRDDILQMKMTIVDGALGAVLFIGLALKKNPLKALLGAAFSLPDSAWRVLTIRYGLFWWACALGNEIARRVLSTHDWALFRTGVMVAAVVFALAQTPFLLKHSQVVAPADPKS